MQNSIVSEYQKYHNICIALLNLKKALKSSPYNTKIILEGIALNKISKDKLSNLFFKLIAKIEDANINTDDSSFFNLISFDDCLKVLLSIDDISFSISRDPLDNKERVYVVNKEDLLLVNKSYFQNTDLKEGFVLHSFFDNQNSDDSFLLFKDKSQDEREMYALVYKNLVAYLKDLLLLSKDSFNSLNLNKLESYLGENEALKLFDKDIVSILVSFITFDDCFILYEKINKVFLDYKETLPLVYKEFYQKETGIISYKNFMQSFFEYLNSLSFENDWYQRSFSISKDAILKNEITKIVLFKGLSIKKECDLILMYHKLKDTYKNAFCYLAKINDNEIWFGASPETLGSFNAKEKIFKTISLAGTQKYDDSIPLNQVKWDLKDIKEQKIVTLYIKDLIEKSGFKVSLDNTHTYKAGVVLHLKNNLKVLDISFKDALALAFLICPTPAVAGFPKDKAIELIKTFRPRSFYSGAVGYFEEDNFSLYVNLRCAKATNSYDIKAFAGGGIISESLLNKEEQEILYKVATIKNLLEV